MSATSSSHRSDIAAQLVEHLQHEAERQPGAVLLTGAWGAGKTHLWKNEVLPKLGKKVAYVSLFGVTNVGELKSKLIASLVADENLDSNSIQKVLNIGTNLVANVHKVAGAAISIAAKTYLGDEAAHLLSALDIRFDALQLVPKDIVICFDDIERKGMPSDEFLGLINTLIDQKSARVVLIANAETLDDKFFGYKEKVVWLTLRCESSIEKLVEEFIEKGATTKNIPVLKNLKSVVVDCFKRAAHENLRTLQRTIRLLDLVSTKLDLPEGYARFLICLIIEDATRPGLQKTAKTYQGNSHHKATLFRQQKEPVKLSEEEQVSKEFYETFFSPTFADGFSPTLHRFVLDGFLDMKALRDEVSPPDTRSEAIKLVQEAHEGDWMFAADDVGKNLSNQIGQMLLSTDDMNIGVALNLRRALGRISRHLDVRTPDLDSVLTERMRKRAAAGDDVNAHDRFFDQGEVDDMTPYYDQYRKIKKEADLSHVRKLVVDSLADGKEPRALLLEHRYTPELLKVLADPTVLDVADNLMKTDRQGHFRFYQFAIERVKSSQESDAQILKSVLEERIEKLKAMPHDTGQLKLLSWLLDALKRPN